MSYNSFSLNNNKLRNESRDNFSDVTLCVIGGSDKRTAFDMFQAKIFTNFLVFSKLIGVYPLHNRMMHFRWLHILANGKHVYLVIHTVLHQLYHLFTCLPETYHYSGFCPESLVFASLKKFQ